MLAVGVSASITLHFIEDHSVHMCSLRLRRLIVQTYRARRPPSVFALNLMPVRFSVNLVCTYARTDPTEVDVPH